MDREAPGTGWTGRVIEVSPDVADDPEQRRVLDRFAANWPRATCPRRDRLVPRLRQGSPRLCRCRTGACRECHRREPRPGPVRARPRLEELQDRASTRPAVAVVPHDRVRLPGGFRSTARSADRTAVVAARVSTSRARHVLRPTERPPSCQGPVPLVPRPREQPALRLRGLLGQDPPRSPRPGAEGGTTMKRQVGPLACAFLLLPATPRAA